MTRLQLNVYAEARGSVVGRLQIRDETGSWIDCSALGNEGKTISGDMSDLKREIISDAKQIIVVEKQGVFMELRFVWLLFGLFVFFNIVVTIDSVDRFYNRMESIIITASGIPDLATRAFVSRLSQDLEIPIFGIADWNAGGALVLKTYRFGSKNR